MSDLTEILIRRNLMQYLISKISLHTKKITDLIKNKNFSFINFDRATIHNFRLVSIDVVANRLPLRRLKQGPRLLDHAPGRFDALDRSTRSSRLHVLAPALHIKVQSPLFVVHVLIDDLRWN